MVGAPNVFEREPEVSRAVIGGVYSPQEGHVEGQRYTQALAHAATRLGALIVEGTEVTGLQIEGTKITGVRTGTGTYASGHTVLAAGPWTGGNRWLPEDLPVRGVKGQRILLRMPGFLPRCPVRNSEAMWSPGPTVICWWARPVKKEGLTSRPQPKASVEWWRRRW